MLKNKSVFSQIVLLVVLAVICIVMTLGMALLAGSVDKDIFDFSNLNFSNMLPVLMIGGFFSCVILVLALLFVARPIFIKVRNYIFEDDGGNKK